MVNVPFQIWKHAFKLDPARFLSEETLDRICGSGTDAIIVGGSSNITYEDTFSLLQRIRKFALPCVLEVSSIEAIVPGFDLYFIPVVLNADNPEWITGHHLRALREYGSMLQWEQVVAEGYIILNDLSTAAALTKARNDLTEQDVVAYARMADKLFRMPIFYMEYSGTFGNMDWVKLAANVLQDARLFYGGGINSAARARKAAEFADTIVVGNIIYENLDQAISTVIAIEKGTIS